MTRRKYRSAKARFEAMGRRDQSLGLPPLRLFLMDAPEWARLAYVTGWDVQEIAARKRQ